LRPEIEAESLDASRPWDVSVIQTIRSYLLVHEPRQTLKMLDDASDRLREALLEHFSLQDVLVAESRSKKRR